MEGCNSSNTYSSKDEIINIVVVKRQKKCVIRKCLKLIGKKKMKRAISYIR